MIWLGVAVLILGLAARWRTAIVVVAAALVTGAGAGMGGRELLQRLGQAFVDHRMLTLFLLTLPTIALSERFGLQAQAASWMERFAGGAKPGRLLWLYQLVRVMQGALGVRMNGHPAFVRPLVAPMACAGQPEERCERLKAAAAASENYANFYGQNLSVIQGGVLLVYGVLKAQGIEVSLWRLVAFACIPAALSLLLGRLQFARLDR